jgi:MarR family transcriptional regulator for hemolysin
MTTISPAKSLLFLMHDVSRLLRRQMDQRAQALGLTSAQWRVLASVARAELLEQQPLSQAVLADQMDMEPITLSRHVDRMEAAGLIERRPNPNDRRAYGLFITDTARPLVDRFRRMSGDCLGSATNGVTDEEIALVTDVLTRMRANIVDSQSRRDVSEDMTVAAARVAGQKL